MLTKANNNIHLTLDDIVQMTLQVGEKWAVAHAERLLALIRQIGRDSILRFPNHGIGGLHA